MSIATRRPSRAASAQAHSTCASWSAGVASIHGMPPTTSAPSAQRLLDQLGRARIAQHAVLREGDDGHVDPAPELLAGGQHRLHAGQPGRGVDVGEGLHVQDAVAQPVGQRLPDRAAAASPAGSAA